MQIPFQQGKRARDSAFLTGCPERRGVEGPEHRSHAQDRHKDGGKHLVPGLFLLGELFVFNACKDD